MISLEPNLFQFNQQVKVLHFGNNRLRSIPHDILDPFEGLAEVSFINNVCVSGEGKTRKEINVIEWQIMNKCQMRMCASENKEINRLKSALNDEIFYLLTFLVT